MIALSEDRGSSRDESRIDAEAARKARRTVLIVDDQSALRRLIHYALRDRYRVLEAEDSESTIATLAEESIDLVLLDLHLPPRLESPSEGLRTYGRIRERSPKLPVVIVTSNTDSTLRQALLGKGAQAYLKKPFDIDTLVNVVDGLLRN